MNSEPNALSTTDPNPAPETTSEATRATPPNPADSDTLEKLSLYDLLYYVLAGPNLSEA